MKLKRLFDFALAVIGLTIAAPILLLLALLVWIFDGRPIFFKQARVGRGGRIFQMYKFRSMRVAQGSALTIGADARITRLGKILRRSKLDELPQLWNVLVAEMSFVGPRPEIEEYVRLYTPAQREVLRLSPGITDPASLKYIDESEVLVKAADPHRFYVETIMPDKIRLNLEYAKSANLLTDLMLIFKTLFRSFSR